MSPEPIQIIELVAAILTIVALAFAWKQFKDAHGHTRALSSLTDKLGKIENALSTRSIGKYPDYVKPITNLLKRATKSICILCDYPGYCSFSDHAQYERYRTALREKIGAEPKLECISLTFLDRTHRDKITEEQFRDAKTNWADWKSANQTKLNPLCKAHGTMLRHRHHKPSGQEVTLDELTHDDFIEMLEADDRRVLDDFSEIGYREANGDISIHFWIIDSREAIFAIPSLDGEALERGFITSDQELIKAFDRLAARYTA